MSCVKLIALWPDLPQDIRSDIFDQSRAALTKCGHVPKYADAEPFLVLGYEFMKQREPKIPKVAKRYLKDSLDRLIQHFEDWAKESEADEWRKKMLAGPS